MDVDLNVYTTVLVIGIFSGFSGLVLVPFAVKKYYFFSGEPLRRGPYLLIKYSRIAGVAFFFTALVFPTLLWLFD